MYKNLKIFLLIAFPLFTSCGKTNAYVPGQITDSIECSEKSGQFYALYLPKGYDGDKKYPVVFFFDPSARGKLPLEKYRYVADSFQVILAGSDNSKNGPLEICTAAANAMIDDVKTRISNIDLQTLLLAGFSGGSRFAYSYSILHPEMKGVIGCGASFPAQTQDVFPPRFNYSLIAGFYDFNFREFYQVKEIFRNNNTPFCFIPFYGGHEWPDSKSFKKALQYQLCLSNGNKNMEANDQLMIALKNQFSEFRDSNNLMAAKWSLEDLLVFEYKSYQTSNYSDSLQKIIKSTDYQNQVTLFDKSLRMEDSLIQEISKVTTAYYQLLKNPLTPIKPMKWWEKEIEKFTLFETDKDIYLQMMGKRLKSQVCIQYWGVNRQLAGAGLYDRSLETAIILTMANPEEPIYYALKAESLSAIGKTKEAKTELESAVQKGFTFDEPSLRNNPYLAKLKSL